MEEETRDFETRKFCVIALADLLENIGVNEEISSSYTWSATEDEKKDDAESDDELNNLGIDLDVTKERHERNRHHKAIEDEPFTFMFSRNTENETDENCLLYDRIFSALLMRFEDYEVDRRGDVGSFVRQH